ncbi:Ig-like domain repeat protein [Candidatus Nephthysia bennettiae]|uniref:Ig-like domain repeat protein n=1 Tax=Candidatus Nephthysia bennettiae TaxID=3127016 RepID=A0A934KFL8_9BACT|nr:Ig-like domain repeat protein [Candidatus Dormibacteraeota bacterium]MBJ7612956.1 Ig-like domain repeat protein [Candidatus Dormibacteraeota bacterium]
MLVRGRLPCTILLFAALLVTGTPSLSAAAAAPLKVQAASPPDHPIEHRPGGSSGQPHGYIPCDLYNAYHLNGTALDGTGVTIAIIDWYLQPSIRSDLRAFDQAFGLPNPPSFDVVFPFGRPTQTDTSDETALDVEWAHAMAPGARIVLVETNLDEGIFNAIRYSAQALNADVVSMSWGTGELGFSRQELQQRDQLMVPLTGNGHPVTYLAAAMDTGFQNATRSAPVPPVSGTAWPAAAPGAIGVGGTSLAPSAFGRSSFPASHTGCSGADPATAGVTQQNETVWGNQCSVPTGNPCGGTGGGPSTFDSRPAWQTTSFSKRTIPDLSMLADPETGVAVYSFGAWVNGLIGGTSLATPMWAGIVARLDQKRHSIGLPSLGVSQSWSWPYAAPSQALNDIVTGSSPAYPNDPCPASLGEMNCAAHAGYDLSTGRGSPSLQALLSALAKPTTLRLSSSSAAGLTAGETLQLTARVSQALGDPAGSVRFSLDGRAAGGAVVLSSDQAGMDLTIQDAGPHTVTAAFTTDPGDPVFGASQGSLALTVSPAPEPPSTGGG